MSVTKHGEDATEREEVEKVQQEHGMHYPAFLDLDGAWSKASGLGNVPSFLLLGRDGRPVYRHAGKLSEGTEAFDALAAAIEKQLGSG